MSVSGIFTSNLFHLASENVQNRHQKFAKEFEQLGKDLQSGDLSAAQADFAALQQLRPQNNSRTSSTQNANPLQADFAQLSTDLKAGNTSAAQKDYATILQDMQNQATQVHGNHHHRHASQGDGKAIEQSLQKLGQALQANDLTTAQQAYTALQQEFQQVRWQHGGFSSNGSGSNSVSVNA